MTQQTTTPGITRITRITPTERAKGQWPGVEPVMTSIHVGEHQRGLWFIRGRFREMLGPGEYPVLRRPWEPDENTVEVYDTRDIVFRHARLDALLSDHAIADALTSVNVPAGSLALVWHGDRFVAALAQGRHALWRSPALRVEVIDTRERLLNHPQHAEAMTHSVARQWLTSEPATAMA